MLGRYIAQITGSFYLVRYLSALVSVLQVAPKTERCREIPLLTGGQEERDGMWGIRD